MINHNSEMFVQQHRTKERVFELRDRRGELRARSEALRAVSKTSGSRTGFGTRIAVATGEVLISFGQKLKELGMANSPSTVRMH